VKKMSSIGRGGRPQFAVFCIALAALIFAAGTCLPPVMESADLNGSWLLRLMYAPICHQQPERSFNILQGTQAVCARCAGLYLGGVAGLFAAAWFVIGKRRGPRPIWLAYALAPTAVDALCSWLGMPSLSELPRHLSAWPAGFVAGLFLADGISDIEVSFRAWQSSGGERSRSSSLVEDFNG
jgi:uncharacterized membrane protein